MSVFRSTNYSVHGGLKCPHFENGSFCNVPDAALTNDGGKCLVVIRLTCFGFAVDLLVHTPHLDIINTTLLITSER